MDKCIADIHHSMKNINNLSDYYYILLNLDKKKKI